MGAGKRTGNRALTAFVIALVGATVLGWLGRFHALFEAVTNIAPQMLLLAVVATAWSALARRRKHAIASGICLLWFLFLLVPYWFASADPRLADPEAVHTALQYNVYFGNGDIDRIVGEIEAADADVIALHEITTDQWLQIGERLPDFAAISLPWDGSDPQLGGGLALLSRTPLTALPVDPDASIEGRPILAATTTIDDQEVVLVGLHPHASRFESHKVDLRDAQLAAVADLLRDETRPALILTDLNMTPTSSDYRGFLKDLDWRDPHRSTGWDASWPTWGGPFGLPIDHVLVSDNIALHDISARGGGGSDHKTVVASFSFAP